MLKEKELMLMSLVVENLDELKDVMVLTMKDEAEACVKSADFIKLAEVSAKANDKIKKLDILKSFMANSFRELAGQDLLSSTPVSGDLGLPIPTELKTLTVDQPNPVTTTGTLIPTAPVQVEVPKPLDVKGLPILEPLLNLPVEPEDTSLLTIVKRAIRVAKPLTGAFDVVKPKGTEKYSKRRWSEISKHESFVLDLSEINETNQRTQLSRLLQELTRDPERIFVKNQDNCPVKKGQYVLNSNGLMLRELLKQNTPLLKWNGVGDLRTMLINTVHILTILHNAGTTVPKYVIETREGINPVYARLKAILEGKSTMDLSAQEDLVIKSLEELKWIRSPFDNGTDSAYAYSHRLTEAGKTRIACIFRKKTDFDLLSHVFDYIKWDVSTSDSINKLRIKPEIDFTVDCTW